MRLLSTLALLLSIIIVGCVSNENSPQPKAEEPGSSEKVQIKLASRFSDLLKEEMNQIQGAMQQLLPLIISGQSVETAQLATQIHNSFILKRSLSPDELKELVASLPGSFIQRDRAFHADAAKLAESARKSDFHTSGQIYGKMVNACIDCHSQFAAKQFPELNKTNKNMHAN